MRLITLTLFCLIALLGCANSSLPYVPTIGIPFVHRIDVQQGNVVTQEMVAQLRLGMDKKKVRYVMGTPIIQDTFHAKRWDYVYTFHEGGGSTERRQVTAIFNDNGNLVGLDGDIKAALGRLEVDKHQDTSVKVPGEYNPGLLAKLKGSLPFTEDGNHKPLPQRKPLPQNETDAANETDEVADGDAENEDTDDLADDGSELVAGVDDESVSVPEGAPPKKKKGFFKSLVDSVGLGADDEDEDDDEDESDSSDERRYRDITDPEYKL